MAALEPDVEFFGIRIPPNATVSFGDEDKRDDSSSGDDDDDDDDVDDGVDGLLGAMSPIDGVALIHATQVALGPNPAPGRHTVMAFKNRGGSGKEKGFPIGTLEVGKTEQFSIDLMWSMVGGGGGGAGGDGAGFDGGEVSFSHTGKSDVFITGYKTVTSMLDNALGYSGGEEEESDEEDFSSDEEEESDEEAPEGVPLKGGGGGDFSSSSSEEDEDEESDDEDSESEEEEDDDEEERGRAFLAAAPPPRTPAGVKRPLGEEESSGDDVESESDGSESDDDETDDSEDGDRPSAPPASKKAKQAAEEVPAAAAAAAYAGALRDFLREHGPTKLGALGAAVRRPAALPKLTTFLAGREDFRVDGEQRVSLVLP